MPYKNRYRFLTLAYVNLFNLVTSCVFHSQMDFSAKLKKVGLLIWLTFNVDFEIYLIFTTLLLLYPLLSLKYDPRARLVYEQTPKYLTLDLAPCFRTNI